MRAEAETAGPDIGVSLDTPLPPGGRWVGRPGPLPITKLAAPEPRPIAVMTTAGHRSMATSRGYLHLAGVVFREEASALEWRLLGYKIRVQSRPNPHR
jgi:hypothetical protein